jgi:hypothetical protein
MLFGHKAAYTGWRFSVRRDADMLKTLRDQAAIAENSLTLFLVMGLFPRCGFP